MQMNEITPSPHAGSEYHPNTMDQDHPRKNWVARSLAVILWLIGLFILAAATVIVRNHPGPWPYELSFTRTVQHIPYLPWIPPILEFIGTFNNPTPTGIVLGVIFTAMLLMGWYRQTIFVALTVGIGNGIDTLFGDYARRPRPLPSLVHVDAILKYNSFPSGHCCHAVLFYGFLLFLSFTKPVRTWRYHLLLIPLQLFALLNILLIGYERIYGGEHWLVDVLGGYLSGALWLALFIVLYQWITRLWQRRQAKKNENQTLHAHEEVGTATA